MHILAAHTAVQMPWKNGLGTTLELATDASVHQPDWTWRLSIADVPERATCSVFPGKRRAIACLDGDGLLLERAHGIDAVPRIGSGVLFEGEESIVCVPLGEGVRDANLMFDRTRWEGTLRIVRATAGAIAGDVILVHVPIASPCDIEVVSEVESVLVRRGETLITTGMAVVSNGEAGTCVLAALSTPSDSTTASTTSGCCGGAGACACACRDAGGMNDAAHGCCAKPRTN